MRICFVTREFQGFTPYTGGLGVRYAAMATEFARQGHELHVLTGPVPPDRAVARNGRVRVHPIEEFRSLWPPPVPGIGRSLRVAAALRRLGPFDVVYAPEWGGDASAYAARKHSGPLITNLTSSLAQILEIAPWPLSARQRPRIALQQRLERRQAERSDALVGCSRAVVDSAAGLWDIDAVPTVVLPNTVDVDRVRELGRRPAALDDLPLEPPIVAFSGRMEGRKGVHVLVEAMNAVWDAMPEVDLVLLGKDSAWEGGPMSRHLLALAGERAQRVHFAGPQAPERLFPVLAAADVVVLPSLWEAFGLAALEAMALGSAVVATTGSGFEEFMESEHDSLLVPPGDTVALGDAILQLLQDAGLRRRLGERAAGVADRFRPEAVVRRHVDYFEHVIAGR
jgi:glycosyltransferase involved in cell wall biosynthesis